MTTVNHGVLTCIAYSQNVIMCFDICVPTVVYVRSLSSEDHIIAFVFTNCWEVWCIIFGEHLQCSKKIFLMLDFLSLRGGVL